MPGAAFSMLRVPCSLAARPTGHDTEENRTDIAQRVSDAVLEVAALHVAVPLSSQNHSVGTGWSSPGRLAARRREEVVLGGVSMLAVHHLSAHVGGCGSREQRDRRGRRRPRTQLATPRHGVSRPPAGRQ